MNSGSEHMVALHWFPWKRRSPGHMYHDVVDLKEGRHEIGAEIECIRNCTVHCTKYCLLISGNSLKGSKLKTFCCWCSLVWSVGGVNS